MRRVIVPVILGIAACLRFQDYTKTPPLNADEYDWAWSGLTLIKNHIPTGWSEFSAYPQFTVMPWQGAMYSLVTPYLDHPPLFSLIVGGLTWLTGARTFTDVDLAVIRLIPISLSLVVLLLAFQFVRSLGGELVGFLTIGALAVSPAAITMARLTESESLLTVWLLLVLLALQELEVNRSSRVSVGVLLACCILAPLTKVPGVVVGGIAVGILLYQRDFKRAILAVWATAVGFATFIIYGGLYNAEVFSNLWNAHLQTHTSWLAGLDLLRGGGGDHLWMLGLIAVAATFFMNRRAAIFLGWPTLAYILLMTSAANPQNAFEYDWYRIPIYPLVYAGLALAAAAAIKEIRGRTRKTSASTQQEDRRQAALN